MTPEAQRIAIAEWCGWHLHYRHKDLDLPFNLQCWAKDQDERPGNDLPDYLNDLNAMHEAWEHLTDSQKFTFRNELAWIRKRTNGFYEGAPASEWAEALLRTIGKWEDTP